MEKKFLVTSKVISHLLPLTPKIPLTSYLLPLKYLSPLKYLKTSRVS